jgi:hypothetical protein
MYLIDSCQIRQLILDEAGARVRLENRRLPLGLRSLMHELQETIKEERLY